jgi:hypothetical protein
MKNDKKFDRWVLQKIAMKKMKKWQVVNSKSGSKSWKKK